jgi:hypothetical protein
LAASNALQIFGITLVGATPENGKKLLLTIALLVVVLLFSAVGIGIASATYEITGLPTLTVERQGARA